MKTKIITGSALFSALFVLADSPAMLQDAPLPVGAPDHPESIADAWRAENSLRSRICLNGLWRVRPPVPGEAAEAFPSEGGWGWGKIPSVWEVSSQESRTKGQCVFYAPADKGRKPPTPIESEAWYRRSFQMPEAAAGRRVFISFELVQTHAVVYLDGEKVGNVYFPCGSVDLTNWVKPGKEQTLTLHVTAFSRNESTFEYTAPDRAELRKTNLTFRGVTGDVYLDLVPQGVRLANPFVNPSVEKGEITFAADLESPSADGKYSLVVTVKGCGEEKTFSSGTLSPDAKGRLAFTAPWKDAKKWDTHTPENRYTCSVALRDADGSLLDETVPFQFGFREMKCMGRDILLNGIPLHARVLHNTTINAAAPICCKESALEMCRRVKNDGYNLIIAGNYNFSAGTVSHMEALLEACDETGLLFSFSLPHARDFDEKLDRPEMVAAYRALADKLIKLVRNHPSVAFYAMNHNYAGYGGDMNPERMDGKYEIPETCMDSCMKRRAQARIAEAVARELDPTRPIYHHESGNLGDFHTSNIYLNWAPIQERSDWLEHWSKEGVKPVFFVEWGLPHVCSWSSYRGPEFIWRCKGFQSCWAEEYAASFFGTSAYEASDKTRDMLSKEAELWATGEPFSWGPFIERLRNWPSKYYDIQALYAADNWRSFRAAGASALLPWDQDTFYQRVKDWRIRPNPNAFRNLKTPGIVPDIFVSDVQYWTDTTERDTFVRNSIGEALVRWNQPDLAFIGGGDDSVTDKRHNYRPSETVEKRLVIVNDRRVAQTIDWTCELRNVEGQKAEWKGGKAEVAAGVCTNIPVSFTMPSEGAWATIIAKFVFEDSVEQEDRFIINRCAEEKTPKGNELYLYDPKGETKAMFTRLGIAFMETDPARLPLAWCKKIIVGRGCLTRELFDRTLLPFARIGGRILVFEQDQPTLESIGFRVQTYGLRNVFPRFWDPLIPGLSPERLRDWAGASTLVPHYFDNLDAAEVNYPKQRWAGFLNAHVWRSGNRGAVSTVIPEKPSVGDWRALADGGFALQYAPLLDWMVERGCVTFCQLDVTARTVPEPVADELVKSLVSRMAFNLPERRIPKAFGFEASIWGRDYEIGLKAGDPGRDAYIVSSGAKKPANFADTIKVGGIALCLGLTAEEVKEWSPVPLNVEEKQDLYYERIAKPPLQLNGLSSADWAWHGPMDFAAFTDSVPDGNNALRVVRYGKGLIIFWQVPPWKIDVESHPYLRISRRAACRMFARLMGNLNFISNASTIHYMDAPVAEDDPYRYYRW